MRVIYPSQVHPEHGSAIICHWMAQRIPHLAEQAPTSTALGVVDDHNQLVGAASFYNWFPHYRSIEIACAADTPRWLTAKVATAIMAYPFKQLGCGRITAITPAPVHGQRTSASRFLEKFGFRQEGRIRKGLGDQDAIVWGLLASEWRFSKWNAERPVVKVNHGQIRPNAPARARPYRHHRRAVAGEHRNRAAAGSAQ